ncbi:MAG: aspartate kinase [Phycisphaeraceae bacterium]|nr:aspartate kinase [Phycisphaeraceae bacterium]
MGLKVCKFGGSSLADASQIAKVRTLVDADPQRRFVVVSAPGKRSREDHKITDLLYLCHEHARQELPFDEVFGRIAQRYLEIVQQLKLSLNLKPALDEVKVGIARVAQDQGTADFAASRGEYLNGLIVAELLGVPFVDPAEIIFFDARGRLDEARTYDTAGQRLKKLKKAVIPGFYGSDAQGRIKTFSRGGSDVTGSIIARAAGADLYENWTDVSGLLMTDPRIVSEPQPIDVVTYRELRELAYMGASVLHDEAIFPVRSAKPRAIPVRILNTNRPDDPGTMIVSEDEPIRHRSTITGIAGRKDFTIISIEKTLMNAEVGYARRLLSVLEKNSISFEHLPSGIDTMSVVIADKQLEGKLDGLLEDIQRECEPDSLEVAANMALIATVGRGMARTPGMASRLFGALASAGVNVRMIDQGSSELNIIVGVEADDFEKAVSAIYHAFV